MIWNGKIRVGLNAIYPRAEPHHPGVFSANNTFMPFHFQQSRHAVTHLDGRLPCDPTAVLSAFSGEQVTHTLASRVMGKHGGRRAEAVGRDRINVDCDELLCLGHFARVNWCLPMFPHCPAPKWE